MTKDTDTVRTSLRLPKTLYDRLAESADDHGMTMHAEILSRLEDSFSASREAAQALELAVNTLERQNLENRRILAEERAMLSQIKLMRYLLDRVAASGGNLDKDLWGAIAILSGREDDATEGPNANLAQLLQNTVDAIEAAEAFSVPSEKKT